MAFLALLCLGVWVYLFAGHGNFWGSCPELAPGAPGAPRDTPRVDIIVPARDEAETIEPVIQSLLDQDYRGDFTVLLVDDGSRDGTADIARAAALRAGAGLRVIAATPKPAGWSGKLWALHQGVAATDARVLLLTDADIVHDRRHLSTLVARLDAPRVDMVSEMVQLNCSSRAEQFLVPAFVYFFQMLYPFCRVNDPLSKVAAAAGGTVLIRREALERIGGFDSIKGALIDDVTLAGAVKRGGAIYLGHSRLATSIRQYPRLADIWHMVARTAFTQLRYSALLLMLTILGLAVVWWLPLGLAVAGHGWQRLCGCAAFALGALSYLPTLGRYRQSPAWALALPAIALFYLAATVGSALSHWGGQGARWKSRDYGGG